MGMNMATIATQAMVEFIESKWDVKCVSITGNFCADKKPAQLNAILGRGKQVWAEVFLTSQVLKGVLKTSVDELVEVFYRKTLIGSALSGSMGFNSHFANVVAALYLATGQDMAHVVDGSVGIATAEKEGKGVRVSVFLPSLILGTVGGGINLPHQQAALKLLGLGKGKAGEAKVLAEIVGGTVLAGEVSLAASLSEGSLAKAHQRLGRKKAKK
jgi:hydroxymethylglutaryl-CoA reductase (NADPH)